MDDNGNSNEPPNQNGSGQDSNGTRNHLRLASSQKTSDRDRDRRFAVLDGQHSSDPAVDPLQEGTPRPALTSIAVKTIDDRVEATASLALSGRVLTGTSAGPVEDRTAIVAAATVSAVAALVDAAAELDTARIVELDGHLLAISVVRLPDESPEFLVGSAVVRGDEEDATARSVLSALNRRLTR
ncbi:MAG: hypothetical protein WAS05_03525 [Candidatus Nanopelagicales bacterium]